MWKTALTTTTTVNLEARVRQSTFLTLSSYSWSDTDTITVAKCLQKRLPEKGPLDVFYGGGACNLYTCNEVSPWCTIIHLTHLMPEQ